MKKPLGKLYKQYRYCFDLSMSILMRNSTGLFAFAVFAKHEFMWRHCKVSCTCVVHDVFNDLRVVYGFSAHREDSK